MRPTILVKDKTLYWTIAVYDTDDALVDADSTPTVAVRKNGASTADVVTVTKRASTTGLYDCSYNPSGEAEGDCFEIGETVVVSATSYYATWTFTTTSQSSASQAGINDSLAVDIFEATYPRLYFRVYDAIGNPATLSGGDLSAVAIDHYHDGQWNAVNDTGVTLTTIYDDGPWVVGRIFKDMVDYPGNLYSVAVNPSLLTDAIALRAKITVANGGYGGIVVDPVVHYVHERSNDWSDTEKQQIRHRLGLDGTKTGPTTTGASLGDTFDPLLAKLPLSGRATTASEVRTELATELARIDTTVSSRLATAGYTAPDNASISAILTDTGTTLPGQISALNDLNAAEVRAAIGLASANLDTQLADIPTVSEFNARSLPSADYFVVSDYTVPPTATQNANAVSEVISADIANSEYGWPAAVSEIAIASASATRQNFTTELARIDVAVSSRATSGEVYTEVENVLMDYSMTGFGSILAKLPESGRTPTATENTTQLINTLLPMSAQELETYGNAQDNTFSFLVTKLRNMRTDSQDTAAETAQTTTITNKLPLSGRTATAAEVSALIAADIVDSDNGWGDARVDLAYSVNVTLTASHGAGAWTTAPWTAQQVSDTVAQQQEILNKVSGTYIAMRGAF